LSGDRYLRLVLSTYFFERAASDQQLATRSVPRLREIGATRPLVSPSAAQVGRLGSPLSPSCGGPFFYRFARRNSREAFRDILIKGSTAAAGKKDSGMPNFEHGQNVHYVWLIGAVLIIVLTAVAAVTLAYKLIQGPPPKPAKGAERAPMAIQFTASTLWEKVGTTAGVPTVATPESLRSGSATG
jgi:hypothetical protein